MSADRRLEAFSDAVFGIAATLLVLELPFPAVSEGDLSDALGEHWPAFVAYVVSFSGIGVAWLHHRLVFDYVQRVNRPLLVLNLIYLLLIAFLPFPTALVGDYLQQGEDAEIAAVLYSGSWTVISAAMAVMWSYVLRRPSLTSDRLAPEAAQRFRRFVLINTCIYALATLVAAFAPEISLSLYLVAFVFFVFEGDYRVVREDPGSFS